MLVLVKISFDLDLVELLLEGALYALYFLQSLVCRHLGIQRLRVIYTFLARNFLKVPLLGVKAGGCFSDCVVLVCLAVQIEGRDFPGQAASRVALSSTTGARLRLVLHLRHRLRAS